MPNEPLTYRPADGGQLLSDLSADTAGLANYTIKRDVRREGDAEVVSEGYDWFCPNPAKFSQPAANGEAITLIAIARRNNRTTAVVVGTASTLFRYYGLDNGAYLYGLGTDDGYVDATYFDLNDGAWITIGSGFSLNAQRWQSVSINGYLVLNNGVDLPVTYRLENSQVQPIWELREQGIASVGWIAELNGILLLANIRQIKAEVHESLMAMKPSALDAGQTGVPRLPGLARINGNTLTSDTNLTLQAGDEVRMANGVTRIVTEVTGAMTATVGGAAVTVEPMQPFYKPVSDGRNLNKTALQMFPAFHSWQLVGKNIYWDSGEIRRVTAVDLDGTVWVSSDQPIPDGPCSIENPLAYAAYTDKANIEHFPWRKMWSMPNQPRRFGAIIPGTLAPNSDVVVMDYPAKSLELGKDYLLTGAGPQGNNITLKLAWQSGRSVRFAGESLSSVAREAALDVMLTAADAEASITGLYEDLIDDGSAILAMLAIRTLLVIYKETAIILCQYTANLNNPFVYEPPIRLHEGTGIGFPHSLVSVQESHCYIGADSRFYTFNLTNRFPQKLAALEPCADIFFGALPEYALGKELRPGNTFQSPEMVMDGLDPDGRFLYVNGDVRQEVGPQYVDESGGRFIVYGQPPEAATFSFRQILDVRQHVFSAHNPLTKEVWWCFPSTTEDGALRWSYETGTVSTTSLQVTAAAAVIKPSTASWIENWFAMGNSVGEVMRYGLVAGEAKSSGAVTASKSPNSAVVTATGPVFSALSVGKSIQLKDGRLFAIVGHIDATRVTVLGSGEVAPQSFWIVPAIYHRAGDAYTAVMQSGVESFGPPDREKSVDQYTLYLADDSPSAELQVFFRAGVNPEKVADVLSATITKPQDWNMIPCWFEGYFLGERVEVRGINHFVRLIRRTWSVRGVNSKSFSRRPNA